MLPQLDPDRLNADCVCITLDREALERRFADATGDARFAHALAASHPHLLSNLPVFLKSCDVASMAELVRTVEAVVQLPGFEAAVLADHPGVYRTAAPGVFMGYDFHLGADGPKLIEINTNAGGALINAALADAQTACCAEAAHMMQTTPRRADLEALFVADFRDAWARVRGAARLHTIAIVDETPEQQYLYPEFVMFKALFESHGLTAVIAAPEAMTFDGTHLMCDGLAIDLVYNRLTDFALATPACGALNAAYRSGRTVVTPNPWAHARLADKQNLVRLTDADFMASCGATAEQIAVLARAIPRTTAVTAANAETLWSKRNSLFFKPAAGFGSRAAYRGDKLTRRVWEGISTSGAYVAQDLVMPSTRNVIVDGQRQALKIDIRNYTYDGTVRLLAARLYQGQTTNFRTPGGGFAPVLSGPASDGCGICGPLRAPHEASAN